MRIVPAAMPVSSATSFMARSTTGFGMVCQDIQHDVECSLFAVDTARPARRGHRRRPAARTRHVDAHRPRTIVLTGATGYVGGRLLPALLEQGHEVRCIVRRPERADLPGGATVVRGDVTEGTGLDEALAGADVAYYLVHSMGRGNGADFARRDREAAATFGAAVRRAGVARTVYLGGLE